MQAADRRLNFDLWLSLAAVEGIEPTDVIFTCEKFKNLWCILLHLFYIYCKEVKINVSNTQNVISLMGYDI